MSLGSKTLRKIPSPGPRQRLVLLREKLQAGDINQGVWETYFPGLPEGQVPGCGDCAAFPVCKYGRDLEPVECFSKPGRHFR